MKFTFTTFLLISFLLFQNIELKSQQAANFTIELARQFSRDLFESNGVLFMEPVVRITNATSNSRFFNYAYIPTKSDNIYFKIGIQGMIGFVSDNLKRYNPSMPTQQFDLNDVSKYISYNPLTNQITKLDTAGIIRYIFLNLMYDGIYGSKKGAITVPTNASTALGSGNSKFLLPHETLKDLFRNHPLYSLPLIPQNLKDSVESYINQFPEEFTLYGGADLSTVFASIPQIEIGSLYGTELLLRFIPPVNLGQTIGDFAFWGVGLKHSISQYFYKEQFNDKNYFELKEIQPFDLAAQFVYQGTYLTNKVGVTQADLTANATILNANLNASYYLNKYINFFTGLSYQTISIESEYVYKLPVEIQWQLGLLEKGKHEPTPGYPGDNSPQKTKLTLDDSSLKWTIGFTASISNIDLIIDYNLSKFDIFGFGLQYRF